MFTPILFNYFIFDAHLFGDQSLYTLDAVDQKLDYDLPNNPNLEKDLWWTSTSILTSKILSIFPLPMLMTLTSLAFANKLMLFLLFVWTSRFLNQDTAVIYGAEHLAKKYNFPVFYYSVKKEKRGYYSFEIFPITDKPQETEYGFITQSHVSHLEKAIKQEPQYWLWSHKRWKLKRE